MAAYGDPGDHPVAGPDLFDREVDHDDVDSGQVLQLGIVDADRRVEHLTEHKHLAGALGEALQRNVRRGQGHGVGFDRGDAQNRNENPFAGQQFDDQAKDPRLLADDADADHHVADAADGLAVGAEHDHPREPGRVDPVDRHHASKGRE